MLHARETGEGQLVDVALVDSIVLLCEMAVYRLRSVWPLGRRQQPPAPGAVRQLSDEGRGLAIPGAGPRHH